MKILFIGDPHLKITRFDLAVRFLAWVTEVILDKKPDMVVNLGDTFDTHAVIRSEVMQEFKKHVQRIIEAGIPYYYVLGNHDFYRPKSSKYHALQSLMGMWKDFHVIESITDINDEITVVPYQPDLSTFPMQTREICIAHQTFVGADYGYKREDVGVNADRVSAEVIISGHVHLRQEFGKVIYPGTPYSQSVDDIDQSKGVMLFDTDTYDKKFILSPLPSWKGLRFELSPSFTVAQLHQELKGSLNKTDHWTVEVTGTKAEVIGYRDSEEYKELIKDIDIKFKPKFVDSDKKLVKIEAVSMEHIVEQYTEKVYQGSLDKSLVSKRALEILKSVRQQPRAHK